MAEQVNMKIGIDSRSAKTAANDLNSFARSASNAEGSTDRLSASQKRLQDAFRSSNTQAIKAAQYIMEIERETKKLTTSAYDLKKYEIAMRAAKAPTLELKKAIREAGAEHLRAMKQINSGTPAIAKMGTSGKLAGHHMQNLAFQLQDVAVGLQGGQRPMSVFMQQGSQIAGIMMQAGVGVRGMTKAILGMVASVTVAIATNPYFLALGAVVVTVAAALNALSTEWEKSGEIEAYAKSIGLTKEQIEEAGGAGITTMDIMKGLWMTISDALNLEGVIDTLKGWFLDFGNLVLDVAKMAGAGLYAAFAGSFNAIKVLWNNFPAILSDIFVRAVNQALSAVEWLVNKIVTAINKLAGEDILNTQKFGRLVNENAGAANKAADAIASGYVDAYNQASQAIDAFGERVKANTIKAAKSRMDAAKEEEKARQASKAAMAEADKLAAKNKKTVDDYIASLEKEIDSLTKTAKQLREEEKARMLAIAVTNDQRKAIEALFAARERALGDKVYKEATDEIKKLNKQIQEELELSELLGAEREMRAIALSEEAKMAELDANALGMTAEQVAELRDQWREYFDGQRGIVQVEERLNREREAAEELKKTLGEITGILSDVFGVDIGGVLNRMNAAFPNLKKDLKEIFKDASRDFKDIFAGLPKLFATAMAGAQIGGLVGGGGKGSQIGGAIGSVAGKAIGSSISALGKLGGPLGTIAGGILGGLIGGMLSSTPRASATVSIIGGEAMMGAVTGNKAQLTKIASGMAGALIDGLESLADELGGFLGDLTGISIGIRKKTYRVDVTGQGRTKGMPTFETEQEAIAYAMKYAIDNGVIEGIRQSTQNLLRAGDDLQAALEDALLFESVFGRLLEATDPLAYGLQQLEKEFTKLRKIFDAAGATAAEYADLEALYQIERQKVLDENNKVEEQALNLAQLNIRLLETEGKALEALAATRQAELDAATEAEQAILRLIYAQEDLNEATREAARITESLAALNIRLLQAQGRTAEATAASRAQELEALSDGEQTILRQIYLLEDLNARRAEEIQALEQAESNLRSVYEREKQTFEETAQKFRDLASALRDFSDTIFNTTRNPIQSLQALERQFFSTAREARLGNVAALEALPSLGGDLRDAVVDTATSRVEMIRKLAAIQRETDAAAEVAERQADNAMTQLEALNEQVKLLIDINDSVMSVDEAIREFLNARAKVGATNAQIVAAGGVAVGPTRMSPAEEYAAKYFQNVPNIKDIGVAMRYMSALAQQLVGQFGMPVGLVQQAHYAAQRAYSQADATSAEIANAFKSTIGFANGGMHSGGLRIVGENGPELEATGASRIYNANQLGAMMSGNGTKEEIKSLREEMRAALFQIAKNTGKTSDQLNRWDGDGLPSTRTWDAA